jgi:hypothetical protein
MMDFAEKGSFLPTPSSSLPSTSSDSIPTQKHATSEKQFQQPPRSPGGTIMTAHGRYDKKPLPKEPLHESSTNPIDYVSPVSSSTTIQNLMDFPPNKPLMTQQEHYTNAVPFTGSHDSLDESTLYSHRTSSNEPSPSGKEGQKKRSRGWKTAVYAFSQFVKGNEGEPSAVDWHAPKHHHHQHRKRG